MKILFHEYGDTPSKRGVRLYLEDGTELPNLVSYSIEPRERGNRLHLRLEMIDVEPVYVDAPPTRARIGSAAPDPTDAQIVEDLYYAHGVKSDVKIVSLIRAALAQPGAVIEPPPDDALTLPSLAHDAKTEEARHCPYSNGECRRNTCNRACVCQAWELMERVRAEPPERIDPMLRRLTALWRYGVTVLPPSAPDFYVWLAELDTAIDERSRRPT